MGLWGLGGQDCRLEAPGQELAQPTSHGTSSGEPPFALRPSTQLEEAYPHHSG